MRGGTGRAGTVRERGSRHRDDEISSELGP